MVDLSTEDERSAAANRIDVELRSRFGRLSERLAELEETLVGYEHDQDELLALRLEAERLINENQELRAEVQAIRQSTSWRVTRPLRGLRGGSSIG